MIKYFFFTFVALLASFTILAASSGLPNDLAYRNYSVIDLDGARDGNYGIEIRHQKALANGCSSVPTSSKPLWVVRCPFWVTP